MEQMSLLKSPEEKAFNLVLPELELIASGYRFEKGSITFEKNKGYYSILFLKKSVIARLGGIKKLYLSVPSSVIYMDNGSSATAPKDKDGYTRIPITSFDEIAAYIPCLKRALVGIIERSGKEFDCCSRYLECSDAKTCTHPDASFALKCGYRTLLSKGKIYYGINRNVDV